MVDNVLIGYDFLFLDERLDVLYNWLLLMFNYRNHSSSSAGNVLRNLNFKARLNAKDDPSLMRELKSLIAQWNRLLLDTTLAVAEFIERSKGTRWEAPFLDGQAKKHTSGDLEIRNSLAGRLREWYPAPQSP